MFIHIEYCVMVQKWFYSQFKRTSLGFMWDDRDFCEIKIFQIFILNFTPQKSFKSKPTKENTQKPCKNHHLYYPRKWNFFRKHFMTFFVNIPCCCAVVTIACGHCWNSTQIVATQKQNLHIVQKMEGGKVSKGKVFVWSFDFMTATAK